MSCQKTQKGEGFPWIIKPASSSKGCSPGHPILYTTADSWSCSAVSVRALPSPRTQQAARSKQDSQKRATVTMAHDPHKQEPSQSVLVMSIKIHTPIRRREGEREKETKPSRAGAVYVCLGTGRGIQRTSVTWMRFILQTFWSNSYLLMTQEKPCLSVTGSEISQMRKWQTKTYTIPLARSYKIALLFLYKENPKCNFHKRSHSKKIPILGF